MKFLNALIIFMLFSLATLAKPLDSLRLELREGKKMIVHRAVAGEKIADIANKYGMDANIIISSNPLIQGEVKPGQLVRIPLNTEKYGEVQVQNVLPVSNTRLPLATSLPPPAEKTSAGKTVFQVTKEPELAVNENLVEPVLPDSRNENERKENERKETTNTEPVIAPPPIIVEKPLTPIEDQKPSKMATNKVKEFQFYVVGSSQTIQQLAASIQQDPEYLMEVNELSSPNLWKGQKLLIPKGSAPMQTPEPKLSAAQRSEKRDSSAAAIKSMWHDVKADAPLSKTEKVDSIAMVESLNQTNAIETPQKEKPNLVSKNDTEIEQEEFKEVKKEKPEYKVASSVQSSHHEVEDKEIDTTIVKHYGRIDEAGVKIENDFSLYENNIVTYSVVDFRDQRIVVDEWAENAADSNALYITPTSNKQGTGDKYFTHVVKNGETLYTIAKKYGVTQSDLANWNALLQYRLREGQELVVNESRGNLSYYERSLPARINKKDFEVDQVYQSGIAYYNPKAKLKGVLLNNVPKGTWVQIKNDDYFDYAYVRVYGPLPKNAPKDCVVMLDDNTAFKLNVSSPKSNVRVIFGEIKKQ
jgi:LysM repeat protein